MNRVVAAISKPISSFSPKMQALRWKIRRSHYVFIHSVTNNIGDLMSCPIDYFPIFSDKKSCRLSCRDFAKAIDSFGPTRLIEFMRGKVVIFGGGGLIALDRHSTHDRVLEFLSSFSRAGGAVAAWGVGHNRMGGWRTWMAENRGRLYPAWLNDFAAVGLRDFRNPYTWVPCVSCMHPAFDREYQTQHEVVAFLHGQESSLVRSAFDGIPQLDNIMSGNKQRSEASFSNVVKLIGSGATLVTNSYHGLYWGTLLKKNVIAMPNSSKFLDFKYPYNVCENLLEWRDLRVERHIHNKALDECREANRAFFDCVKALS